MRNVVLGLALLSLNVWLAPRTYAANSEAVIEGVTDKDLKGYLEKSLAAVENLPEQQDEKAARRYEVSRTRDTLKKALAAQGYYDSDIKFNRSRKGADKMVFIVTPGSRTIIHAVKFEGMPPQSVSIQPGQPLLAQSVLDEQKRLFQKMSDKGCLYDLKISHIAILDNETHKADLIFSMEDKGDAQLGRIRFSGLKRVKEGYARKLIDLKEGQCYKAANIEKAQADLLQGGQFSIVRIDLPDQSQNGIVPVTIEVKESKPRTIKSGLTYYTDEGPGIALGWEHRNLFGRGEKLSLDLKLSSLLQSLATTFKKPFFLRKDQTLNLGAELKSDNTDAYDAETLNFHGDVGRQITKSLTLGAGGGYEVARVKDNEESNNYALLYGLGYADWDNRDDTLDSHKGYKARLDLKPFIDTLDPGTVFWKTETAVSTYFAFEPKSVIDPVLAIRGRFGSIVGPATKNLPAIERFYAGGGGSIRGFDYQSIGPHNDDGKPSGGRSVIETSAELRFKITDTIGMVGFIDGGTVSEAVVPTSGNGYALGAGLGLRYYTSLGPLRFDVGVPLNQRKETDSAAFQIYLSIGQAF